MDSIQKNETVSGVIWKFLERTGAYLLSFIVSVVLARILSPDEFGYIAIVMIVISFCDVLVESGLGTALVQKKDADSLDFSTVTIFSLFFSIVLFGIVFLCTPLLETMEKFNGLGIYIRVMAVRIIFSGYNSVQNAYIIRSMKFRKNFIVSIVSTAASAVIGIFMAYNGYGLWALVAQYLTNSIISTVVLTFISGLKFKLKFSFQRLKTIYKFAFSLLLGGLVDVFYNELKAIVIGFKYDTDDLAYYNRANSIPTLAGNSINGALDNVIFSVMSKNQSNISELKKILSNFISVSTFIVMPVFVGIALLSEDIILLLYTERWAECIPYMTFIAISFIFIPINNGNLSAFKALGKSKLLLELNLIKKGIYTVILLIAMNFGVYWIAFASIPINITAIIVNGFPSKKYLNYSLWEQIRDIMPTVLPCLIMAAGVFAVGLIEMNFYLSIIIKVFTGVILFSVFSLIFRIKGCKILLGLIKSYFSKKKSAKESIDKEI